VAGSTSTAANWIGLLLITKGSDYVSGGAAKFRLYHVTAGVGTHDMWLDVAYVLTVGI
jgi:hypothetical protein